MSDLNRQDIVKFIAIPQANLLNFRGVKLEEIDISDLNLSNIDFEFSSFKKVIGTNTIHNNSLFKGSRFEESKLYIMGNDINFDNTQFKDSTLRLNLKNAKSDSFSIFQTKITFPTNIYNSKFSYFYINCSLFEETSSLKKCLNLEHTQFDEFILEVCSKTNISAYDCKFGKLKISFSEITSLNFDYCTIDTLLIGSDSHFSQQNLSFTNCQLSQQAKDLLENLDIKHN